MQAKGLMVAFQVVISQNFVIDKPHPLARGRSKANMCLLGTRDRTNNKCSQTVPKVKGCVKTSTHTCTRNTK